MPPFCDVLIVHSGGNDLGTGESPEAIADRYIDRYKDCAKIVVFCSVVRRLESSPHVHPGFKNLSRKFNTQLNLRTTHFSHLHYYFHDPRLQNPNNMHADGVHLSQRGLKRFFFSLHRAIKSGICHLALLPPLPSLHPNDH